MANHVAIVGGGLAGLAAAAALAARGCQVELFEARRKLGGRAGSFLDRATGESIDHCQHVAMGCCTNFLDFCRLTGIESLLQRHSTLYFYGPDGRRSDFSPARWLPAPLHLLPALWSLTFLSTFDKLAIGRAMLRLIRTPSVAAPDEPTVLQWLSQQKQSGTAIDCFWKVVLVSALAESLEQASLSAARKVFVDGFLAHRAASDVIVPCVSLDELYDHRVAGWLEKNGAIIHRESTVTQVLGDENCATGLRMSDGSDRPFDVVVLAVPWMRVGKLLAPQIAAVVDPENRFLGILESPISSVHLWFDRPLTDLPHAVLIGRLSQWVFARNINAASGEHYYQVVISASHELSGRDRQQVIDEVVGDLTAAFPATTAAKLLRWQLITDHQAVFSVWPGIDSVRPTQQTRVPYLLLAGDWTGTGWPATMEGAVRSGYLAAEGVLARLGRPERILVADLPRNWLTRWF